MKDLERDRLMQGVNLLVDELQDLKIRNKVLSMLCDRASGHMAKISNKDEAVNWYKDYREATKK